MTTLLEPEQLVELDSNSYKTIHIYLKRGRPSGHPVPQIGDVALCGWVKRTPSRKFHPIDTVSCHVCNDLSGGI